MRNKITNVCGLLLIMLCMIPSVASSSSRVAARAPGKLGSLQRIIHHEEGAKVFQTKKFSDPTAAAAHTAAAKANTQLQNSSFSDRLTGKRAKLTKNAQSTSDAAQNLN
jgi:hypothetical protein